MKVWDRTETELTTPGSAVWHASVARHVRTRLEAVKTKSIDVDSDKSLDTKPV